MLAPVSVIQPTFGKLTQELQLNGYIESETTITVVPKISGTLDNLYVDIGDEVKKDEVIAEIDSESYELTLQQAEASYLAAKSTYERTKQLYDAQATSRQNYDQAKSQYDAAKSQYELARLHYTYTTIRSPIDGTVLKKHTAAGSLVGPQVPIMTIGDLDNLEIKAKIPEKYYELFVNKKNGIPVTLTLPALQNRKLPARIETVSPYISPETKNFEAVCKISGDFSTVRPGMFINMTFVLDEVLEVYYLPFQALVGGEHLWFVDPRENTAHRIDYSLSYYTNDYFKVPEKYKEYLFILEGQHFLRQGQKVKLINETG